MAIKIKSSDVKKVATVFDVGVATTIISDKLVIPAVKKTIKEKKAAKATVDVNVNKSNDKTTSDDE